MAGNIISNPFVGCTARDMKFEEVQQYWCSPFQLYQLNEGELFESKTPIVIEGMRGTGKTMILKYLSYSVQKDSIKELTLSQKLSFLKERNVGVYFRYKEDFCNLFDLLDCDFKDKERIFMHYFELSIVRKMLEILEDIYQENDSSLIENVICSYLDIECRSLEKIRTYINHIIRQMDKIINDAGHDLSWRNKIMSMVGNGNMIVEFIQTISYSLSEWSDILFVILMDEYENLGRFQTIINTLIKQVDDTTNLTYRIGMRPAGMDNNNGTKVAGESLQVDRDFLLRRLEYKSMAEYKRFAIAISEKRLKSIELYRESGIIDINTILGKKENFDAEAEAVVNGTKHFKLLNKYVSGIDLQDAILELTCDDKLMEMYNILRVMRGEDYKETGELCRKYQMIEKKRLIISLCEITNRLEAA